MQGGRWHKQQHDFLSLPVYVRDNTLLAALGNSQKRLPRWHEGTAFSYSIWMTVAGDARSPATGWFDNNLYAAGETRRQYHYGERRRRAAFNWTL
ncbi:hypothetical protein KCP74_06095 [Salmonella enterica subsp. enterica]|nr:hypothetical protein KCP74_06095 [Salmonella enterica subsp. enterica]